MDDDGSVPNMLAYHHVDVKSGAKLCAIKLTGTLGHANTDNPLGAGDTGSRNNLDEFILFNSNHEVRCSFVLQNATTDPQASTAADTSPRVEIIEVNMRPQHEQRIMQIIRLQANRRFQLKLRAIGNETQAWEDEIDDALNIRRARKEEMLAKVKKRDAEIIRLAKEWQKDRDSWAAFFRQQLHATPLSHSLFFEATLFLFCAVFVEVVVQMSGGDILFQFWNMLGCNLLIILVLATLGVRFLVSMLEVLLDIKLVRC